MELSKIIMLLTAIYIKQWDVFISDTDSEHTYEGSGNFIKTEDEWYGKKLIFYFWIK